MEFERKNMYKVVYWSKEDQGTADEDIRYAMFETKDAAEAFIIGWTAIGNYATLNKWTWVTDIEY